ncbi:hypothetical protein FB567DRAFT_514554 [Paraphoma chrysanthemicola]|uniref:DUF3176 domain containing protein n=1 Tax=Paraphoma chrysanthemicola TaxID=798071 RepID=A0A8K0RFF9_9PLEO|nr:hypothetical protein FB567DRAFT_514554 [Paraphoma chrysanthemicola]
MIERNPPSYEQLYVRHPQSSETRHHDTLRPFLLRTGSSNDHNILSSTGSVSKEKSPLDITQRLERKLAEYNASQNVFKRWLFEILSWLISALCMAAVVVIYVYISDRPMSGVSMSITAANVLGKVASAALIVPTSEALGQLKWNWFHSSKAMWDFEIFDKASRGPWGAALLLFRTKGRSLAALGALLIVLLLAIDTFFQQVIDFPSRWALQSAMSSIPRVVNYEPLYLIEYWQKWETNQADKNLRPIVQEFLYNNGTQPITFGNGTRPDIPLSCPTSNCTWPTYETFAVCSACLDVSDSLDLSYACLDMPVDWTNTWPGPPGKVPYPNGTACGYFLNVTSDKPTLLSGFVEKKMATNFTADEALLVRTLPLTTFLTKKRLYDTGSINFSSIRNPIVDFLLASARGGPDSVFNKERPVVHECVLSWCVQEITSSYSYGEYHEEVHAVYQNKTPGPNPWLSYEIPEAEGGGTWTEYHENVTITPPPSRLGNPPRPGYNDVYGTTNTSLNMVLYLFDDFFPSFYTFFSNATRPQLRYKEYMDGPYSRALPFNPWLAPNNITRHVEKLARAMTNGMRSSLSREMLSGQAYQQEVYVKIQWEWLSFPFALLILSLIFLVATIAKTAGDGATGLWKTSAMPTLIYGLPRDVQNELSVSETVGQTARKQAGKVRIKLLPDRGWRVSGRMSTARSPTVMNTNVRPGWI